MKIQYFSDTDTIYFDLMAKPSSQTEAVTDELIVDFDFDRNVVGITLEQASRAIDLSSIETINLPEIIARAS